MKNKLGFMAGMIISVMGIWSCITFDDRLDLDRELSLDMKLGADGLYIPVGTLDTIWMDSLLKTGNMGGASVRCLDNGVLGISLTGRIDSASYNLEPMTVIPQMSLVKQSAAVSLGDGMDFLFNKDNDLKISDMTIALNLRYVLPADMSISAGMMSKDRNGNVISGGLTTPDDGGIVIPGSSAPDDTCSVTLLFYAKDAPDISGTDTVPVKISGLPQLLSAMPDSILFQLDASVADNTVQTFRFNNLFVTGSYEVTMPMAFDSMTVAYTDTVAGLGEELEAVAGYLGAVEARLVAGYESSVPFGIELSVWAIDSLKNVIPEISMAPAAIPAGSETEVKTETVDFSLSVQDGGIGKIDGFTFTAKCVADGVSVKSGGYILVKDVFLAFDEGLDVDLSKASYENRCD